MEPLAGQRQKGESAKAIQALNDYLRIGPGRSLADLARQYNETPQNAATLSLYTLQAWSKRYDWQQRAELYDMALEAAKNERAREIMQTGLSLTHERVMKLKELATLLEEQMLERGEDERLHNIWLPDVKQIGSGEYAERVDIERFNAAIIDQYRGTLDDLAKETGGRVHKADLTSGGEKLDLTPFASALEKVYGDGDQRADP